jgi:hypothetical protein
MATLGHIHAQRAEGLAATGHSCRGNRDRPEPILKSGILYFIYVFMCSVVRIRLMALMRARP